jgi:hypothetical protein
MSAEIEIRPLPFVMTEKTHIQQIKIPFVEDLTSTYLGPMIAVVCFAGTFTHALLRSNCSPSPFAPDQENKNRNKVNSILVITLHIYHCCDDTETYQFHIDILPSWSLAISRGRCEWIISGIQDTTAICCTFHMENIG